VLSLLVVRWLLELESNNQNCQKETEFAAAESVETVGQSDSDSDSDSNYPYSY
jgi:hypothetical protein